MEGKTILRKVLWLGLVAALCAIRLQAQAREGQSPAFEVASIKENVSASDNASVRAQPGGRVTVSNNSLRNIIRNAYNVQTTCGTRTTRGNMMTTGVAMSDFARNLGPFTGRPVVDKSGLTGVYDLDLTWTPDQGPPGPEGTAAAAPSSGDGVSLYTAVQEQLGLKLEAQRGPVDVLVIDSAQRPVED